MNAAHVLAFILVLTGCQEHTPLVNRSALQAYQREQALLAPSGPFGEVREPSTKERVLDESLSPSSPGQVDSTKPAPAPNNVTDPSTSPSSEDPNSDETPANPTLPEQPENYLSTRSFTGTSSGTGAKISIHASQSAVLSPQETRPVIFVPPSSFEAGFIRRGNQDVTLEGYHPESRRYKPTGQTFQYACDWSGKCYRLPSNLDKSRDLELYAWQDRMIPLVAYRYGASVDKGGAVAQSFLEIRHDPNYLGARYAEIFDRQTPPVHWKAFLFQKNFETFDRVFVTADLRFEPTSEPNEYVVSITRFSSEKSPGPWKTMKVNLDDELPWRRADTTANTRSMEIYISDNEKSPSLSGKVSDNHGTETWFIAFPDPQKTLPLLASAGK